jgi:hypothetical protein
MIKTRKRVFFMNVSGLNFKYSDCFGIRNSDFEFLLAAENDFLTFAGSVHLEFFSTIAD